MKYLSVIRRSRRQLALWREDRSGCILMKVQEESYRTRNVALKFVGCSVCLMEPPPPAGQGSNLRLWKEDRSRGLADTYKWLCVVYYK